MQARLHVAHEQCIYKMASSEAANLKIDSFRFASLEKDIQDTMHVGKQCNNFFEYIHICRYSDGSARVADGFGPRKYTLMCCSMCIGERKMVLELLPFCYGPANSMAQSWAHHLWNYSTLLPYYSGISLNGFYGNTSRICLFDWISSAYAIQFKWGRLEKVVKTIAHCGKFRFVRQIANSRQCNHRTVTCIHQKYTQQFTIIHALRRFI